MEPLTEIKVNKRERVMEGLTEGGRGRDRGRGIDGGTEGEGGTERERGREERRDGE